MTSGADDTVLDAVLAVQLTVLGWWDTDAWLLRRGPMARKEAEAA